MQNEQGTLIGNAPDDVAELVNRCVRGDDQAQALFYTQHVDVVRRSAAYTLRSYSNESPLINEVEDICNEVFVRLFTDSCRSLRSLRNPKSVKAWLVTVTRRYTVDYIRKWGGDRVRRVEMREEHESYGSDSEQQVANGERDVMLSRCLSALSDEERLILTLFFVHGRKYIEIAAVTGRNINTVSAKLRRAKAKLRRLLEEERYECPQR
ncbi:MAG: RNA polymerase sigma factor [Candidatus Eisenbacteria bacterium]